MTSNPLTNLVKIGQLDAVPFSQRHHQTTLQCLTHTLGVDATVIRILDGLRKQRNLSDYDGEMVTDAALTECIGQAKTLLESAKQRLQ